jgi:DNA-binding NarL/FixJ family response regulator
VQTIKTLIVDDSADFRRRVKEFLSSEPDVEVVGQAADVEEALRKTRTLKPDVVLMDVRLPRTNGISATREIQERMPDVKVIILSRFDLQEYREAAEACGASAYVIKRAMIRDLVPTIRRAFSKPASVRVEA